jgi:hypothetical protein
MAAVRTIVTLAEARTQFRSELDLVEAGVAGRIKATAQQGEITRNDWVSLLPARDYLRQIIRWGASEIWLEPGNHKTGVLIDIIGETPRRQRGDTERVRAELLYRAALPHLPGSLAWTAEEARTKAKEIFPGDRLLGVSIEIVRRAWQIAKVRLQEEAAPKPP